MSVATDASGSGWGDHMISPVTKVMSDYWTAEELRWDITTKEAAAVDKLLLSCKDELSNAWVDTWVDNQAVIQAWNNQRCRSSTLNHALKSLFHTTSRLNISLHLHYIASEDNPADLPSRRLSATDSKLSDDMWQIVQNEFGGQEGHSCDLMAIDSNAMKDRYGVPLPHFTPWPSPGSLGVNLFAQDMSRHISVLRHCMFFLRVY